MRSPRTGRAGRARTDSSSDSLGPVGWLFADMAMALVIIVLAAQGLSASPQDSPPLNQAAHIEKTTAGRMEKRPVSFTVKVDSKAMRSGEAAALAKFRKDLAAKIRPLQQANRSAAMVLVFGSAPEVTDGMVLASKAAGQFTKTSPRIFRSTAMRTFWANGKPDLIKIEIYLFGK